MRRNNMDLRTKTQGLRAPFPVALLLAAALLLGGCAREDVSSGEPPEDRLLVCASFYTMADFSGKIAGDRAEVVNLVPSGGEPHDWEPSAKDVALLEKADVLILNGGGFEHWVDGVLPSLANQALRVVDTSAGIERPGDPAEGGGDPHIWLDPTNALLQMQAIRDALALADPENAAYYSDNLSVYESACAELDAAYREAIDALPGREIVVAHEAFGYLCARYGLRQISAQGLSPEGEPSPAQMAEAIKAAGETGVRIVFFEERTSPKVAEAIAREIGAETAVLSPLEGLTEKQAAAGGDYFSVMRENLEQLKRALS